MTQNEHDKFTEIFSDILAYSGIEYASSIDGESYVVYNNDGIIFSISYYKRLKKYALANATLLKKEYQKHGLPSDSLPNCQKVYETVAFAYKTRQIVTKAQKDFSSIYTNLLIDSDIIYQMRGNFKTYMVMNSGIAGYAIGYDAKTGKYGFKRYELVNILYTICGIPEDRKPDYASLYKKAKDCYLAQVALENAQYIYDI